MCVISLVDRERPSEQMVKKMWERNDHGGGVAWQDIDQETGESWCHWKKGLSLEEMQEMCAKLPMPYIAHFRIASSGGRFPELTHPFPVEHDPSSELEGRTKGFVLFHNGDWKEWREMMVQVSAASGVHLPDGRISDSRAMAFISSIIGLKFMDLYGFRGIAMSSDSVEVFVGPGWKEIGKIWCSNDLFWYGQTGLGRMCKANHCTRRDIDADTLCRVHCAKGKECVEHKLPIPYQTPQAHRGGTTTDATEGSKGQKCLPAAIDLSKLGPGGYGTATIEVSVKDKIAELSGGAQPLDPFTVTRKAEQEFLDNRMSKNMLKKIRKRLTGTTSQIEAVMRTPLVQGIQSQAVH